MSINADGPPAVAAVAMQRNYGRHHVLQGVDLLLPQGKILGLLGPSGCGKTTFLKCVVGRLFIDGGSLKVLGQAPCARGHEVPGKLIGYMPQEIALYNEFTLHETLVYCAKLHGIPPERFRERKSMLLRLMDMGAFEHRTVGTLSGGQKRRASFAVAMLHDPKLLILDEPTVGVDPLLRARLWQHLVMLASTTGVSIIITTHYIEEARQADLVCMMREGRILAQDTPTMLLERFQKATLEEVFLEMCRQQSHRRRHSSQHAVLAGQDSSTGSNGREVMIALRGGAKGQADVNDEQEDTWSDDDELLDEDAPLLSVTAPARGNDVSGGLVNGAGSGSGSKKSWCRDPVRIPRWHQTVTMLWKNVTRLRRNIGLLLFSFFIPSIQVILYFLAIGRDPTGLHMAVLNQDAGFDGVRVSDVYLGNLESSTIRLDYVSNYADGLDLVHHGSAWGVYQFGPNYSADMFARYVLHNTSDAVIAGSQLLLAMDTSNQQIAYTIQQKTLEAFQAVAVSLGPAAAASASLPLTNLPPIYGPAHPTFTDFIAPGIMITITFAQAIALTAVAFVVDRKEGLLDRTWAMGVYPAEVILGHTLCQIIIIAGQVALMLIFALLAFSLPMAGSLGYIILLMGLLGLAGMLYGLFISTISPEETHAMQMALGSFFPVLLLSGVIWPLEAIPTGLNYISMVLPTTWAAEAMRSIMLRGWGMDRQPVWCGFLVVFAWVIVFFIGGIRGVRRVD